MHHNYGDMYLLRVPIITAGVQAGRDPPVFNFDSNKLVSLFANSAHLSEREMVLVLIMESSGNEITLKNKTPDPKTGGS